jgi:hypothetical protein
VGLADLFAGQDDDSLDLEDMETCCGAEAAQPEGATASAQTPNSSPPPQIGPQQPSVHQAEARATSQRPAQTDRSHGKTTGVVRRPWLQALGCLVEARHRERHAQQHRQGLAQPDLPQQAPLDQPPQCPLQPRPHSRRAHLGASVHASIGEQASVLQGLHTGMLGAGDCRLPLEHMDSRNEQDIAYALPPSTIVRPQGMTDTVVCIDLYQPCLVMSPL